MVTTCDAPYWKHGGAHRFDPAGDGYCAQSAPGSCSGERADAYHFRCSLVAGHAGEHADLVTDAPDVILWHADPYADPPSPVRYAVVGTVTIDHPSGWRQTLGLPTFYLDSSVQGLRSVEDATRVARHILDPFHRYGRDLVVTVMAL